MSLKAQCGDISTDYVHAHGVMMKNLAEKMTKTGAIMGRPEKWPVDSPVWNQIVHRVSAGKSLSTVLADDDMPTWPTFHAMLKQNDTLREAYDKAVQDRADKMADEILELSDQEMPAGLEGAMASAWVQQKRMQVDARKWIASKLKPRVYGDRIDMTVRDERISVIGALEAAQSRVKSLASIDVTDVLPKVKLLVDNSDDDGSN
jgi:hypothetical protein